MEVDKVEKIMLSNQITAIQKNILIMAYALMQKNERCTARNISDALGLNYANCASNLRTLMYADILKCEGLGGRAGKDYTVNWEAF